MDRTHPPADRRLAGDQPAHPRIKYLHTAPKPPRQFLHRTMSMITEGLGYRICCQRSGSTFAPQGGSVNTTPNPQNLLPSEFYASGQMYRIPPAAYFLPTHARATLSRSSRADSSRASHRSISSIKSGLDMGTSMGTSPPDCVFPRELVDCSNPIGVTCSRIPRNSAASAAGFLGIFLWISTVDACHAFTYVPPSP